MEEILWALVFLVYLCAKLVTGPHLCLWKAPVCHIAVIFSICMSSVALGFLVGTQRPACRFIQLLCHTFLLFLFKCCVSFSFFSSTPLFFSLTFFPCLSSLCAVFLLATHFLLPYSIHKVQSADLRRVSAPPDSFTV